MLYEVGDLIYLTQDYCHNRRVDNIPWKIMKKNYFSRHFDESDKLYGYTIVYGAVGYGHDIRVIDIM